MHTVDVKEVYAWTYMKKMHAKASTAVVWKYVLRWKFVAYKVSINKNFCVTAIFEVKSTQFLNNKGSIF